MKKFLLSFVSLFASAACFAAIGDTVVVDGITYTATSDTEAEVSDAESTVTKAVIPASVEINGTTYTVTAIGESAFYYSKVTSAELPNTVTEIKDKGFYNCPLAAIKFGTGLKSIGRYGLSYTQLTSIAIPEGVEKIDDSAFFRTDKLQTVTFPSTLKEIGPSCFYKSAITSVDLPGSLETLGNKAFLNCSKLTDVTLGEGITAIGEGTFYGTAITSITLPSTVTSIGDEAFYDAPLASFTIPAGLESIGSSAFSGTNIEKFDIDPANKSFSIVDDVVYTADKSLLVVFPAKCATIELTLPDACIGISGAAFDRTGIRKVTVGNKFRAIDGFAFCQSQLAEFNFPESLVFIGEQAFAGTQLTKVELPANLPELQQATFAECKSLTEVTLPASLNYIGIRAFFNCAALATVNCKAMVPPVLEDWYEAYESPFYKISSSAVCNVPVGTADAYKATSWKSLFASFNETLPATLIPTVDPEDGTAISEFSGVTLTFAEDMTILEAHPAITVTKGRLVAGVPVGETVSVDEWYFTSNSKTALSLWPSDYDGYIAPFKMEEGSDYYVAIPEGICKNSAGTVNSAMLLHYAGSYVAPKVEILSVDPDYGTSLEEICTINIEFAEKVNLQSSKLSDIKVTKGSADGEVVAVEKWWAVNGTTSGTKLGIFAGDAYDGYTSPIALEEGTDYYVTLPAGLFRLASTWSATSPEIVLYYQSSKSGIADIEADNASQAEYYNLQGVRVAEPSNGIYILRQGNKVSKVLVK